MQQMRYTKANYYDQLSLLAEMGGTYTSILGIMATVYAFFFQKYYYKLAHEKYCVANFTYEEDRTSKYEESNALQLKVEKILNPHYCSETACDIHETRSFKNDFGSFGDKIKRILSRKKTDAEKAKEEEDNVKMSDFQKNINYFGSLDHFYQLEMENEVLKKVVLKINEGMEKVKEEI